MRREPNLEESMSAGASTTADVARQWFRCSQQAVVAGRRAEAIGYLKQAVAADPDHIPSRLWLAGLSANPHESLLHLAHVLTLDPRNEAAHQGIRWARKRMTVGCTETPTVSPTSRPVELGEFTSAPITSSTADVLPTPTAFPERPPAAKPVAGTGIRARWTRWGVASALSTVLHPTAAARLILQHVLLAWPLAVLITMALIFVPTGLQMDRNAWQSTARGQVYGNYLPCFSCFAEAYTAYLSQVASGRLETSSRSHMPITDVITHGGMVTGTTLALTLLVAILPGILIGASTYRQQRSGRGTIWLLVTLLAMSLPSWLLLLVLLMPTVWLSRQSGLQLIRLTGGFELDQRVILPVLVLALRPVAYIARTTSLALEEVFRQDFIRTARAKGLRSAHIWLRHVLPHLLLPWSAAILASLRFTFAALVILEAVLSWPGLGFLTLNDLDIPIRAYIRGSADYGEAATIAAVMVTLFLALDTVYGLMIQKIDPRLRGAL